MTTRRALPLLAALLLGSVHAAAQPAPLALEDVLASTERSFPLLEAARLEQRAADAELHAARGGFDPIARARVVGAPTGYYRSVRLEAQLEAPTPLWGATFFAGYRYAYGSFPSYYGYQDTGAGGELRAAVSLPLLRNGPIDRRRANLQRAEAGVSAQGAATEQQRFEARRAAAARYWAWVASGRRVRVARALLAQAEERDAGLAARVAQGDLPALERTENQRAILQRRGQLVAAERALQQASLELSLFLRDAQGEPVLPDAARLPDAMPEPDALAPARLEADHARARAQRPELRRLEAQRAQARVERDFARNQLWPQLDLTLSVSGDLGAAPGARPDLSSAYQPVVEAGVSFEMPLLNRAAQGRARAAEAALARVEAQQQLARDRVSVELRDAASALAAAFERVRVAREELTVARALVQGERQRFEAGDATLLVLNLREQAAAEASLREVEALADWSRARADYDAAAARLTGPAARP